MLRKVLRKCCLVFLVGCMGCLPTNKNNAETTDYSRCNATSKNYMAETADGFFFVEDWMLYYADKKDMTTWVPACNKPNCMHESEKNIDECNAYVPSGNQIVQKNGKLYAIDRNLIQSMIEIDEIQTDGSGSKKVYELPLEKSSSAGLALAVSQNQVLINHSYLDEKGIMQYRLMRLDENSCDTLYSTDDAVFLLSANVYYGIRGDDAYILNLSTENDSNLWNTLWRIEEDSFEQVNLPEDISLSESVGANLSGNTFTYFVQNEGFYQYDLTTEEKKLVYVNALENSRGYIFSNDCMIELNRYVNYSPEDASIRIYNKTEWMEVELPEEVKNSEDAFYPVSVASDRIFFSQTENEKSHLYYVMLDDETLELVDCGIVSSVTESESNTIEESMGSNEQDTLDDIIIFDNAYCLLKVTDAYILEDEYVVNTSLKMKGNWYKGEGQSYYDVSLDSVIVDGIEYEALDTYSEWGQLYEEKEEEAYQVTIGVIEELSDWYGIEDYTNIELCYSLKDNVTGETIEKNSINIYPQGEENVKYYIRESEPTDMVLLENDDIAIILIGYEQNEIPNDTVTLFIQNKTNEGLYIKVPVASINGINSYRKKNVFDVDTFFVSAKSCVFRTVSCFEPEFLENNNITDVGMIELLIKAYQCEANEKSMDISKLLVNEHVSLYPNGIEERTYYERQSQATGQLPLS